MEIIRKPSSLPVVSGLDSVQSAAVEQSPSVVQFDPNRVDEEEHGARKLPEGSRSLEEKPTLAAPVGADVALAVMMRELMKAMKDATVAQKQSHLGRTQERNFVIASIKDQVQSLRDSNIAELVGGVLEGSFTGLAGVARLGYITRNLRGVAPGETNTIQKVLAQAEAVSGVMTGIGKVSSSVGSFAGKQFQADSKFEESHEKSAHFTQSDEDEFVRGSKEVFQSASRVLSEAAQIQYSTMRDMYQKM